MPLTDVEVKNLKPADRPRRVSDGGGLFVEIKPNGSKLWRLAYRYDGKQRLLALGEYDAVSLKDAREEREKAKKALKEGIDPFVKRKLDRLAEVERRAVTFSVVAEELIAKKRAEGRAPATLAKTEWLMGFAMAEFGTRPISEIGAPEALEALRKVERRGRLESARRLRSVIGEVFRYAIATARASSDPTFALRGALTAPKVKHRAAVQTPAELGALLRAIDGFAGQPTTVAALKLMALLFPRPGELRLAHWSEFELEKAVWTIPASRTKMRREHKVPLAPQGVAILRNLHALTGHGRLVFPGHGVGGHAGKPVEPRPISENTMNAALRRMGYGPDEMTSHGFRAVASTLLNECGKWSPDAIERALAHQDDDHVRRAYNRAQHWAERAAMATWWADQLDKWREGARVIPLRA